MKHYVILLAQLLPAICKLDYDSLAHTKHVIYNIRISQSIYSVATRLKVWWDTEA